MKRSSSFVPYQHGVRQPLQVKDASDFLRSHDKMAALLPAVTRMAALQKDCAAALPIMFESCAVLQFEAGQLVLATPNSALATKLKQQLPKLQDELHRRGWQVNAIRLKVQVTNIYHKASQNKQLNLPGQAIRALAELDTTLEESPRNAALKEAITSLLRRHQNPS